MGLSTGPTFRGEDYVHSHGWSANAGNLFFIACTSCLLSFCWSEDHEEGKASGFNLMVDYGQNFFAGVII